MGLGASLLQRWTGKAWGEGMLGFGGEEVRGSGWCCFGAVCLYIAVGRFEGAIYVLVAFALVVTAAVAAVDLKAGAVAKRLL